jgi:hypothetical protein
MKIYVTNKTLDKLAGMVDTLKPDFINVRKFKKDSDSEANLVKGIKLSEQQRKHHRTGLPYRIYVSKEKLLNLKNRDGIEEGGFLPLLPLILGGVSAVGALAGGSAAVAKTIIDKQTNDKKLEEERRHNEALESAARGETGEGFYLNPPKTGSSFCPKQIIKDFSNKLKTDEIGKKSIRSILKNMSEYVNIQPGKKGNGLFLTPY